MYVVPILHMLFTIVSVATASRRASVSNSDNANDSFKCYVVEALVILCAPAAGLAGCICCFVLWAEMDSGASDVNADRCYAVTVAWPMTEIFLWFSSCCSLIAMFCAYMDHEYGS